jgi:hypothetical protein
MEITRESRDDGVALSNNASSFAIGDPFLRPA